MSNRLYEEPSKITAVQGEVQLDGPDGVAFALTPEAAAETSDRLLYGAAQATGQKLAIDKDARERASRAGGAKIEE